MVVLNSGLNRIRDLVDTDIDSAVAGTGTTAINFGDTSLVSEVAGATDSSPVVAKSDRTLQVTHYIPTTSANGSLLTEWGLELNSGSTLMSRTLTAPVTKTVAVEVTRIVLVYFDRE